MRALAEKTDFRDSAARTDPVKLAGAWVWSESVLTFPFSSFPDRIPAAMNRRPLEPRVTAGPLTMPASYKER